MASVMTLGFSLVSIRFLVAKKKKKKEEFTLKSAPPKRRLKSKLQ